MKYSPSHLKKSLGGKISSKSLKGDKKARSQAIMAAIEKKRKGIDKHTREKKMSGINSPFD